MSQENLQTDDLDRRIITALSADSRRSYADVGVEVVVELAAHPGIGVCEEEGGGGVSVRDSEAFGFSF